MTDRGDLEAQLRALAGSDLGAAPPERIEEAYAAMIAHPDYPCVGAKSVFRREAARVLVLDSAESPECLGRLAAALNRFAGEVRPEGDLASLLAVFRAPVPDDEEAFEAFLWGVLQRLHDADDAPWAPGISSDPADPFFSFSHGGSGFFVVGLHPHASRIARRAPLPSLVFNLHAQFERLRRDGEFARMRTTIRKRDVRLQGSVNPMATDHGTMSEARQYAGRVVGTDWRAPFRPKEQAGD